jgi:pantetheine-phosphate adenylyltransferase, bacterial
MNKRCIYPGSYDPITYGHMDIIERAKGLFEEVILIVSSNVAKTSTFSMEERVNLLNELYKDDTKVRAISWDGLTVNAAVSLDAKAIIRGLRIVSDFEYEFQMNLANNVLNPKIETVFFMTKTENAFISSSMVREVHRLGGDVSAFVPNEVIAFLNQNKDRR